VARGFLHTALGSMLLLLASANAAFAQESEGGVSGPYDTLGPWKIANTIIFVAIIGYFLYKKAPAFFNARSADIQRAIRESTGLKMEADLRYSAMDRKMATLADEVKKLREQAAADMEREHHRRQQETEEGIQRIQANLTAQIQAFRQAGIRSLRNQTAQAAVNLAAQRLQEQAGPRVPDQSLNEFIHLVEKGRS
jgi:F0F1-type ATP synthase membrane subunit b/b'